MKLYYGRGLYTPTRALIISDPRATFYQTTLLDYVFNKTMCPNDPKVDKQYNQQLDMIKLEEITHTPVEMSPDRTYGFPGSLYLRTSMLALRATANTATLYVELDDVNDNRIFILYRLRQIGYELETVADCDTEE